MLVCAKCAVFGTRDRGCSVHPAFPAPSVSVEGQRICKSSGEPCREKADAYPLPTASLRKQGPIRRGGCCENKMVDGFASATASGGYGSLLSKGRHLLMRKRLQLNRLPP